VKASAMMSPDSVIEIWSSNVNADEAVDPVLPDGCRDLIFVAAGGEAPIWFVTDIFDHAFAPITYGKDTYFRGYRFKAGTCISEDALVRSLLGKEPNDTHEILNTIADHTHIDLNTADSLACIAAANLPVSTYARQCGVSTRTFQRSLLTSTGKPASYWRQLARIRQAGRGITLETCLADYAFA